MADVLAGWPRPNELTSVAALQQAAVKAQGILLDLQSDRRTVLSAYSWLEEIGNRTPFRLGAIHFQPHRPADPFHPNDSDFLDTALAILRWCDSSEARELEGPIQKPKGKPGPKGPTQEKIQEWRELERDWLRYCLDCEQREKPIRPRQNADWQRWRCEHGESDPGLSLDDAIQRRKEFNQHLKRHPDDGVSGGNSSDAG